MKIILFSFLLFSQIFLCSYALDFLPLTRQLQGVPATQNNVTFDYSECAVEAQYFSNDVKDLYNTFKEKQIQIKDLADDLSYIVEGVPKLLRSCGMADLAGKVEAFLPQFKPEDCMGDVQNLTDSMNRLKNLTTNFSREMLTPVALETIELYKATQSTLLNCLGVNIKSLILPTSVNYCIDSLNKVYEEFQNLREISSTGANFSTIIQSVQNTNTAISSVMNFCELSNLTRSLDGTTLNREFCISNISDIYQLTNSLMNAFKNGNFKEFISGLPKLSEEFISMYSTCFNIKLPAYLQEYSVLAATCAQNVREIISDNADFQAAIRENNKTAIVGKMQELLEDTNLISKTCGLSNFSVVQYGFQYIDKINPQACTIDFENLKISSQSILQAFNSSDRKTLIKSAFLFLEEVKVMISDCSGISIELHMNESKSTESCLLEMESLLTVGNELKQDYLAGNYMDLIDDLRNLTLLIPSVSSMCHINNTINDFIQTVNPSDCFTDIEIIVKLVSGIENAVKQGNFSEISVETRRLSNIVQKAFKDCVNFNISSALVNITHTVTECGEEISKVIEIVASLYQALPSGNMTQLAQSFRGLVDEVPSLFAQCRITNESVIQDYTKNINAEFCSTDVFELETMGKNIINDFKIQNYSYITEKMSDYVDLLDKTIIDCTGNKITYSNYSKAAFLCISDVEYFVRGAAEFSDAVKNPNNNITDLIKMAQRTFDDSRDILKDCGLGGSVVETVIKRINPYECLQDLEFASLYANELKMDVDASDFKEFVSDLRTVIMHIQNATLNCLNIDVSQYRLIKGFTHCLNDTRKFSEDFKVITKAILGGDTPLAIFISIARLVTDVKEAFSQCGTILTSTANQVVEFLFKTDAEKIALFEIDTQGIDCQEKMSNVKDLVLSEDEACSQTQYNSNLVRIEKEGTEALNACIRRKNQELIE